MDSPNTNHNHIIFSLQQNEDSEIQNHPYLISFQKEDHTPDLHEHLSMMEGIAKSSINIPSSSNKKKAGNRASNKPNNLPATFPGRDVEDDQTQKKIVHREIEKQRRQEMSKLYTSLRGLLPMEFVKGNRSVSDHMNQAVHYIKQKEEDVKEISIKRDGLKKLFDTNESSMNYISNTVSVNFGINGGVEILINSCSTEEGFSLSQVLNTLIEEGLNIVSCSSTKVNDRLFHSIQSEVSEQAYFDPSMLQQRLVSVANSQPNFS